MLGVATVLASICCGLFDAIRVVAATTIAVKQIINKNSPNLILGSSLVCSFAEIMTVRTWL